jgi:hypothetical protein
VQSLVRINALWTLYGFTLEEWLKFRSLEARSHSCGRISPQHNLYGLLTVSLGTR